MTSRSNEVVLYFKSTKHRVAPRVYWFLHSSRRNTDRDLPVQTTLEEIADIINTNRHSVSRALRLLRELGIVRYRRDNYGLMIDEVSDSLMGNNT